MEVPTTSKTSSKNPGRKDDQDKLRWDLLPWEAVEEVVKVLTFGAKKYAPFNWQRVEDSRERYFAALQRHIIAWWRGERVDPDTGLNPLAHVICCALFLLWFDLEKDS